MTQSKAVPFLIGIPNIGVSLLWAMNMNLMPLLVGEFTTENQKIGWLTSMGALTGMFVQYAAGLLSDRCTAKMGRRKPFILGGSLIATVFLCLLPFAPSYGALFALGFLFYFSLNFYQGPYYSLIPEVVDHKQLGVANGFAKIIGVLGASIIFLTGPTLWKMGHAYPFLLAAALGLSSVLVTFFLVKEDTTKQAKPTKIAFDFYRFPAVLQLFAVVFFVFLSLGSITPFFVKYCTDYLAVSSQTASTALLALTLSGAALAYPIGLLADKTNYRYVLILGLVLFSGGLVAASLMDPGISHYVIYVAMGFVGVGYIGIQITSFALLAEIVPSERLGEFMGLMNLFISLPQFLGTNIMGWIIDNFGYKIYLPSAVGMMLVAAFLAVVFKIKRPQALATAL